MPQISFVKPNRKPIEVGENENLMKSLLKNNIPVASSCGGEAVCSLCKIKIVSGMENLSTETEAEEVLRSTHHIPSQFRISCQTQVYGDIVIDAGYW